MFDAACIDHRFEITGGIISIVNGATIGGYFLHDVTETIDRVYGIDIAWIGYLRDLIQRIQRLAGYATGCIGDFCQTVTCRPRTL